MKRRWSLPVFVCLLAATALLLQSFQTTVAGRTESMAATYSGGVLRVTIPPRATWAAGGQLSAELLSPEEEVLARATGSAGGGGDWSVELKAAKAPALEDVMWHRVRYRFRPDADGEVVEGTESVSEILRVPSLHIIGQSEYLAGAQAAVRAVATDSKGTPLTGSLRIELVRPEGRTALFTGRLNERGAAEAQFRMPAGVAGSYQLRYVAETALGTAEYVQPIQIKDKVSILLTTEKPIYQPGQLIHARALALDRADRHAAAGRGLTFELEDSRGNKVFRKAARTDPFGIASAEFPLADEVNLGTYHLRARIDEGNTADLAINVDRYVLPKFKVAVELTGKAKHGYRPGDRVTGVVRSHYFFGKAVEGEVWVKAVGMDVAQFQTDASTGRTDAAGEYRFEVRLPDYLAGRSGAARVLLEATVKDPAGHAESRGEPITVSAESILLTAIPEAGALVPGIENQVFVLAAYPDGKPARATLEVAGGRVETDESGVATVRVGGGVTELRITARDREGNSASATVPLQRRQGEEQVLLRADKAVYRAGDRIAIQVFSTRQKGAVYVDVVKHRQTVLTRDVDLANGRAELSLTATPELAGTLDLNAYVIGRDARTVSDHRLVFVQPADELKIQASAERPEYKPGNDARVRFRVTNARGEGVQAALGVQVVDEAVFALAEKQPGFAKVFFYLEQEVMKPRYEIHSIGMTDVVEQRELAAKALFAATETVRANRFETVAGRELPRGKQWEYFLRYRTQLVAAVNRRPTEYASLRDPWGSAVRVRNTWLESAGPDKQFATADDLTVFLRRETVPDEMTVRVEHDRGPDNGRVEITGVVLGETPGREVVLRGGGTTRRVWTGGRGEFTFSALLPGRYTIELGALAREISLVARDRAVVSVKTRAGVLTAVAEPWERDARRFDLRGVVGGVSGGVAGGTPGGVIGGIIGSPVMFAMAPPPPRMAAMKAEARAKEVIPQEQARVRSYFPEALYINPSLITDGNGNATISIPLADSITTWRMALTASTTRGALGSSTGAIKVFQDFFTDLDVPVTLTQGDRVSIPAAVYNYTGGRGEVSLRLENADWFTLVEDTAEKSLAVESARVGGAQFTIEAKRIGKFKLTLKASMTGRADIVVREIEVVPNGREQTAAFNGRLEASASHDVSFPPEAIPDAGKVFVRLYPGPLSQVIEGMDAILRMPYGCFEQTSSATYPNVLALDYMKRTKKLTPEIRARAEGFIATGYQRLLTYEVAGGGFSWFGNPPAHQILTAYGLMEFADMAKVYDVDPRLIQRTQQWLASKQQADGSWRPDDGGIREGAINRYVSDAVRLTAYVAWSLENTGYRGPAIGKARQYVEAHAGEKADAYTLAVIANFAAEYPGDRAFARQAVERLLAAKTEKDDKAWWTSEETGLYGRGASAAVETTGLAVQALLKSGEAPAIARKALNYVASMKDASGTWGTTQATIMALRAVLLSTEKGAADVRGTVEVSLNGRPVERLTLTADNNDLYHQFVLKGVDPRGANRVDLRFTGQGSLAYQVAGRHFVPWTAKPANEPLSIDVTYDRTRLSEDDIATATATVRNHMTRSAAMVMIDLGIPPGFDLLSEDLQEIQEKTANRKGGRLEKFNLTATQAILYFDAIPAGGTVQVKYRLRAKYPIRARTFRSRVYEYYDPSIGSVARPAALEVEKRRAVQ